LTEDALANHGLTVTYVALIDMRVEGFYAMCAGEITLSGGQQKAFAFAGPRHGVALLVWVAKRNHARLTGLELLAHAYARAQLVAKTQGLAGIALDPFDRETSDIWQSAPYNFRTSETILHNGLRRLWRPMSGAQGLVSTTADEP
jgi:hypothetical protein